MHLANWIASRDNPLTARVMVNRIWQQMMGRGLVATSSDFGNTGESPTHPELLDWLAAEFVDHGWSVKWIYELIASSAAYRQASTGNEAAYKVDPENKLLGRMNRKRLDGEALRDAMLFASGDLSFKMAGPSIYPELPTELKTGAWKTTTDATERNRRSIYVFVKRNLRYPLFALFDSPDRTETCSKRFATTTAPQALSLLNDSITLGFAKSLSARVKREGADTHEKTIDRLVLLCLNRKPTSEERATMADFLSRHPADASLATQDLAHAILNLNEFLFID